MKLVVPDTSIIIEGLLSRKKPKIDKLIISEAVIAELESQANKRREVGYLGLEEIKKLRKIYKTEFSGERPKEFEIKFARSGEIDSIIRSLAQKRNAWLYTGDIVQALVAEAKGIKVKLFRKNVREKLTGLETFLKRDVMSIHLKENSNVLLKRGKPGKWKLEKLKPIKNIEDLAVNLIGVARRRQDAYIESDSKAMTILQIGKIRIVITRPPFSSTYEISAVRQIKKLSVKEYKLNPELLARLEKKAEGILIAGSPGSGKSTFAQALTEFYRKKQKIVKTLESPRDLQVNKDITQFSLSHASNKDIRDMMLLSRPDTTVFDEVRNDKDFELYADLRLAGVGMIGVVHGTQAIDSLQRFIQRMDLGIIPNVIDTLIFIKDGKVDAVYSVAMQVKVPYGMIEADLARPVVGVNDLSTGLLKYEVYSYGDQKVVMPVGEEYTSGVLNLARKEVERELKKIHESAKAYVMHNKILVHTADAKKYLGENKRLVRGLEKKFGMKIDLKQVKKKVKKALTQITYDYRIEGNNLYLIVKPELAGKEFDIYVEKDFVMRARAGKNGKIKISLSSAQAKLIKNALKENKATIKESK